MRARAKTQLHSTRMSIHHHSGSGARARMHTCTHLLSCAQGHPCRIPTGSCTLHLASENSCDRLLPARHTVACAIPRHDAMRLQYGAGAERAATIDCACIVIALMPHVWRELRLANPAISSHRLFGAREGEPSKRLAVSPRHLGTLNAHYFLALKRPAPPISFSDHSACHQAGFCAGVIIELPILHQRCGQSQSRRVQLPRALGVLSRCTDIDVEPQD
jgi:hypothetical protein